MSTGKGTGLNTSGIRDRPEAPVAHAAPCLQVLRIVPHAVILRSCRNSRSIYRTNCPPPWAALARICPALFWEALALEAYRAGKLSTAQLRQVLGLQTRMEVDGFLKAHGLELEYTLQDLERDREAHRQLGL